jgi:hypothetical protein
LNEVEDQQEGRKEKPQGQRGHERD